MNIGPWNFLCAGLLTLYTVAAFSAGQNSDCWGAGNTIEQSRCFANELKTLDGELNATYQRLIHLARNHGEEWVQDLRAAQRKWLEFRKLNCEFFGNYLKEGTGVGLYYADCEVRMTREREAELKIKADELTRRGYR